ncbi:MAG: hypothetical protein EAZ77_07440 [Nostocales cyanobacterium]|nr:MAG: hypothetical protein EAZ77_07440 [Nostocales cyanobacterium]
MIELAKKVLYCLQMMELICWVTDFIPGDFQKRVVARYVLVYLDSFFKFAGELKNQIDRNTIGISKQKIKKNSQNINKLQHDDYESFYSKIRDKLAAHRKDLSIVELVEVWNEIDNTTVKVFVQDAIDIYKSMGELNSIIPRFISSPDLANLELQERLNDLFNEPIQIEISSDNLAPTRQNTIYALASNELQERVFQIVSISKTLFYIIKLENTFIVGQDTHRLWKVMVILDIFNFIDNIYPRAERYKIKSLLEICQESQLRGYSILNAAYNSRDILREDKFRQIRNKIAAHVEVKKETSIAELLAELDSIDINEIHDEIFIPADKSLEQWCNADITNRMLCINTSPVIGVTEVEDLGGYKPYS